MKGFLASVESKLSNKRFILNAPKDVIAIEKKKVEDAKEKINLIEKSLAGSLIFMSNFLNSTFYSIV